MHFFRNKETKLFTNFYIVEFEVRHLKGNYIFGEMETLEILVKFFNTYFSFFSPVTMGGGGGFLIE